jgi:hypothetical protein
MVMAWSWVAAVLVLASPASAAQLRGVTLTPNWFAQGTVFAMTSEDQRAEIARAARMGSNVVRLHVDWPGLQPDGQIDDAYQAQLDQAVQSANHYGQAVIVDVTTTPCWAGKEPVCPLTRPHRFDPPRPEAFGELTRYLLARYPSLYALEVWNEPNCCPPVARFWNGTPADFAAIVNAAVDARNGIGSRTRVIVGGFLPIWNAGAGMLNDVYEAGMRGQDGISIHPYSMVDGQWTNPMKPSSPFNELIRATHQIMLAHGDRGGLYLTEFGFAPCPARPCVPAPIAQRWIANSYRDAARYRYVRALTAFSARDYATGADVGWQVHSGILNRPFGQIRRMLLRLNSKHPRKRRGKRHVGRKKGASTGR